MINVWLVSPLTGTGVAGDPFRPKLSDDFPALNWMDDTGRAVESLPVLPSAIEVLATCDAAQLSALKADTNYYILATEENS